MTHETLFENLQSLNSYEAAGYEYLKRYGKPLDHAQFIYMFRNSGSIYSLEALTSPRASRLQQEIRQNFHKDFHTTGLTEEAFFPEGKNMEIEKQLRYIDIPLHKHNFLECAFVLSGSCTHQVDEHSYEQTAGCCTMIVPGVDHYLVPAPDCVCLSVKIKDATFKKMNIPNLPYFVFPISFQCGDDAFVRHTLLSIYEQQQNGRPYSEQIMEQLFQTLLTYIMQNYRDTLQHMVLQIMPNAQLLEILNYMFENYQTITLTALADHFHFNASYLSRLLHSQLGTSFSGLLKEFKLKQAARYLAETDFAMNEICGTIGYKDSSQFIRSFRQRFGMTPMNYRKAHKDPSEINYINAQNKK